MLKILESELFLSSVKMQFFIETKIEKKNRQKFVFGRSV